MDRPRFRTLMDLLEQALDLPESRRDGWLEERCSHDPAMLAEARALLDLASGPARHDVSRDLEARVGGAALAAASARSHPERIGRYVVQGVLGEGGMGTVYAARQGEPLDREVALKVVRGGILTPHAAARFEAEMHVLASLDHPHIARIFDAGTTDDGVPYFAMERIHGRPITEFCDEEGLTVRDRLELFIEVLKAVGHAHQKAVVHQDLKPSNILVAEFGEDPVPKVIDFGISAVLSDVHEGRPEGPPGAGDGRGSAGATPAVAGGEPAARFGTPAYMSPEAAAGDTVDTRSDVYSLGVLLHELVTGGRPAEGDASPVGAGAGSAYEGGPTADSAIRAARSPTAGSLPGDLRSVVGKAMAPEPDARYGSVRELADDMVRYLTGHPVAARARTPGYRLRRFVGRHRLGVLGVSAAAVLLLAVSAIFTLRLAEERDRARIEAEKATQVAEFLEGLFRIPDPGTAADRDLTARELLDHGAERIATKLADQPEVQASLLGVIGRTYQGLGLWREAEARLLDALEGERALKGDRHPDVAARLHDLGDVRNVLADFDGAEAALREALALRRELLGPAHPETAHTMTLLGLVLRNAGELPEAESMTRESVELLRRADAAGVGPDPGDRPAGPSRALLARALHNLGFVLRSQERLAEAEGAYREALGLRRQLHEPTHPDVLETLGNLAIVLERRGRYDEAESSLRQVLESRRARLGEDHPLTLTSLNNLAYMLWRVGRYGRARALFREAVPIARRVHGPEHPTTAIMINNLGVAVLRYGDAAAAAELHRQALAMNRRSLGPEHPRVAADLDNLGRALLAAGDRRGAEALHREALEMRSHLLGDDHPDVAASLSGLAAARAEAGAPREAVALLRRALELQEARWSSPSPRILETTHDLGVALDAAGDPAEAESHLRRALEGRTAVLGPGHPDVGMTRRALATLLRETGRFEEAEEHLLEARRHAVDRLGIEDRLTRAIDEELDRLRVARDGSADR